MTSRILPCDRSWCFIADFGMARSYSARPLTAGVVTIWYRAPELLLGTKYYTPSIDLWSAGLVLAELLQSSPLLTGETIGEQLSLIVKLLGSPTSDDIAEFSAMGCPELIRWRRESLPSGRVDNVERRFLDRTSPETINFLKGLLSWSPGARWTAAEALGKGRSGSSVDAGKWWQEFPRATDQEFLPTYPEVRNGEAVRGLEHTEETADARPSQSSKASKASTSDYLFDFDGKGILQRPMKRPRSRWIIKNVCGSYRVPDVSLNNWTTKYSVNRTLYTSPTYPVKSIRIVLPYRRVMLQLSAWQAPRLTTQAGRQATTQAHTFSFPANQFLFIPLVKELYGTCNSIILVGAFSAWPYFFGG